MQSSILIARFLLYFCSEQMNNDAQYFMNELNSSHTLGLDDIAMTMPYNQTRGDEMMDEEDEVEEIGESQVKRKPRTGNYKIDEDKALC